MYIVVAAVVIEGFEGFRKISLMVIDILALMIDTLPLVIDTSDLVIDTLALATNISVLVYSRLGCRMCVFRSY